MAEVFSPIRLWNFKKRIVETMRRVAVVLLNPTACDGKIVAVCIGLIVAGESIAAGEIGSPKQN